VKLLTRVAAAVSLIALATGCAADTVPGVASDDGTDGSGRWSDIDTTRPSEDLVGTVYGYVQAMAAGDDSRACAFQYRGPAHREERCVLTEQIPSRDRRFDPAEWDAFASYDLEDYRPTHRRAGWQVSLPTSPAVTWRVTQDDAGLWFVD
jgi:hypothetical protein